MKDFSEKASELFMKGHSCSESVVQAAYERGIIDKSVDVEFLNRISSSFSGAMGSHECLCGAVAGAQLTLGVVFGRKDFQNDPHEIKKIAAEFNKRFKEKRNATCCRVLRAKFKDNPVEARQNCAGIVKDASSILQDIVVERSGMPASKNSIF
ncbi:MAG TPA: C-GCAxxG-C-C family protein [Candidatus Gastranaerophilales bacterium]|nr:C-GCAxxG-C-C family protein [Candidatus Gastranaerophilales bacterium]